MTAFVKDLLTPLIAALVGKPDFSTYVFEVNGSKSLYGDFLNALVAFLLIAAAAYYSVVLPVNAWMARTQKEEPPAAPDKQKCPECQSETPIAARKCAFCTSAVA